MTSPQPLRSLDPDRFREAVKGSDMVPEDFDAEGWLAGPNRMFVDGDNVGLATFEYHGVYNVHWYYKSARGRAAINLAKEMLHCLFQTTDAKAVRGLTRADLKAARWASRQVGMKSYGLIEMNTGVHELFCMTKDDFYKENKQWVA